MTPAEEDFIYKTLRQIERLLAIPDLTPAEAKMLRQNLGGSTSMEISAQASGDLKELLKLGLITHQEMKDKTKKSKQNEK